MYVGGEGEEDCQEADDGFSHAEFEEWEACARECGNPYGLHLIGKEAVKEGVVLPASEEAGCKSNFGHPLVEWH